MKLVDTGNPVRAAWLAEQHYRLDAAPYLSGAFEARKLLQQLSVPKAPLRTLTAGYDGGIYNGPQFRRMYVNDPEYGVPFLGSTDIMEADLSNLPLLSKRSAETDKLAHLRVSPEMSLISCSGTVGRMCYTRPDMDGFWSSQDVLKVVADTTQTEPGYLHAFLSSKYGIPMVTSPASGTMIRHLEPEHIAELPVPRFGSEIEGRIHALIQEAAELRAAFQAGIVAATRDLFTSAGLPELADLQWHNQPRDLGFSVPKVGATSLRAMNFAPRAQQILDTLRSVHYRTLGDICKSGQLNRGNRFKRIDSDPNHGFLLIGQRQGFWIRPEGRWITLSTHDAPNVKVDDETVLIAARGTLGENEVYCRPIFVTGTWQRFAYSEDFLRVTSSDQEVPGAYLFALLRSEVAFRVIRSMSTGGKQQDIHEGMRQQIPVPMCTPADRERIAETVWQAYRDRDAADRKEDEALALLDDAVREAAR